MVTYYSIFLLYSTHYEFYFYECNVNTIQHNIAWEFYIMKEPQQLEKQFCIRCYMMAIKKEYKIIKEWLKVLTYYNYNMIEKRKKKNKRSIERKGRFSNRLQKYLQYKDSFMAKCIPSTQK